MSTYGIVYRVVNLKNGKSYIGKTKSHYGSVEFGVKGRLRQHLANAYMRSRQNECPLFYRAVRKHGKESFIVETLLECPLDNLDFFEISLIEKYDSSNRKFGYNIALGGKGRTVVEISENVREKISKAQNSGEMNIRKMFRKGVLVGYYVRRRQNGKVYNKCFSSTKHSLEENLKLASDYLEGIKTGNCSDNPYNKNGVLPKGICYNKNRKGEINGYLAFFSKEGKRLAKSFASSKLSMEDKLSLAKEWLTQAKKGETSDSEYDNLTRRSQEMKTSLSPRTRRENP